MSSYRLDRVLLVISTCKFCSGCAMQFEGSGATSGRQGQWFLHHDNAPSHKSLVVKQFLTSPNHRTLRISLPTPYSENGPQGDTFCNHGGHEVECDDLTPEDSKRSLLPVLPTMAGSIEQVCVHKGPTFKVIR
jgi:hypothetical protein